MLICVSQIRCDATFSDERCRQTSTPFGFGCKCERASRGKMSNRRRSKSHRPCDLYLALGAPSPCGENQEGCVAITVAAKLAINRNRPPTQPPTLRIEPIYPNSRQVELGRNRVTTRFFSFLSRIVGRAMCDRLHVEHGSMRDTSSFSKRRAVVPRPNSFDPEQNKNLGSSLRLRQPSRTT